MSPLSVNAEGYFDVADGLEIKWRARERERERNRISVSSARILL